MIKKQFKKGFSLVELLVVITIMAILSVVAYQAFGGQTASARNARRTQDLSSIQSALEIFFIENGNRYPAQLDDGDPNTNTDDLVPKYISKISKDPYETAPDTFPDYKYGKSGKTYQLGATLETDTGYKAYLIGNAASTLFDGAATPDNPGGNCSTINYNDGSTGCAPYIIW